MSKTALPDDKQPHNKAIDGDEAINSRPVAHWYFDFISPFSYLQLHRLDRLGEVDVRFCPVLFAGLLQHWGQLGPAEIEPKRRFTYRYSVWSAQHRGIGLRYPPEHPFNPLRVLRLCLALDCKAQVVRAIFDFIWSEGRDPNLEWDALCNGLDLTVDQANEMIASDRVKLQLRNNTETAIAAGIFGVPTLRINGENFWGDDATDMARDFIAQPVLFDSPEMHHATDLARSKLLTRN